MTRSRYFRWLLHAMAWALFFLLPVISAQNLKMLSNAKFVPHERPLIIQIATGVSFLVLFYVNYFLLFPYFLRNKRVVTYAMLFFMAAIVVYVLQDYILFHYITPLGGGVEQKYHVHFSPFISMFLLVAAMGSGVRVAEEWVKAEQHNKEIEKEKSDAELASLKAQINPHFLFNALNTIYSLIITESDKAGEAVINLSTMMRYVMQKPQGSFVELKEEINHLESYIEFQQLRSTPKLTIDYEILMDDVNRYKIAPLVLIPFIENAFKYGISTHEISIIKIRLLVHNNDLLLCVDNRIFKSECISNANAGIGMNNTRRRLELIYGDKYSLEVTNNDESFSVVLKINIA